MLSPSEADTPASLPSHLPGTTTPPHGWKERGGRFRVSPPPARRRTKVARKGIRMRLYRDCERVRFAPDINVTTDRYTQNSPTVPLLPSKSGQHTNPRYVVPRLHESSKDLNRLRMTRAGVRRVSFRRSGQRIPPPPPSDWWCVVGGKTVEGTRLAR